MSNENFNPLAYIVSHGTVQAFVYRQGDKQTPMFLQHYGRAEYDSHKPILSESLRKQGQVVCDALNSGEIDETEAIQKLRQI